MGQHEDVVDHHDSTSESEVFLSLLLHAFASTKKKYVNKYRAKSLDYHLLFRQLHTLDSVTALQTLGQVLNQVLEEMCNSVSRHCMVLVVIASDLLASPISHL